MKKKKLEGSQKGTQKFNFYYVSTVRWYCYRNSGSGPNKTLGFQSEKRDSNLLDKSIFSQNKVLTWLSQTFGFANYVKIYKFQ